MNPNSMALGQILRSDELPSVMSENTEIGFHIMIFTSEKTFQKLEKEQYSQKYPEFRNSEFSYGSGIQPHNVKRTHNECMRTFQMME